MVRPAGQPAAAARARRSADRGCGGSAGWVFAELRLSSRRGAAALWLTFASLVVWSLGAEVIQAWVIRRGLRRWTAEESVAAPAQPRSERPAKAQARPHALALALPLALSTLAFGLVGGIGAGPAARRASRVALLVLIAVWLHSSAGSQGLRAVSLHRANCDAPDR